MQFAGMRTDERKIRRSQWNTSLNILFKTIGDESESNEMNKDILATFSKKGAHPKRGKTGNDIGGSNRFHDFWRI